MTAIKLAVILATAAICGCVRQHQISSSQQTGKVGPAAASREPEGESAGAMLGTWQSRDHEILLSLGSDESWKWWDLSQTKGRPPEPPALAGQWFLRKGVLYLRIDQTKEEPERIGPGLAFALEVKSVSPDAIILHHPRESNNMNFKRIAEPDGPANRSQPVRSDPNGTPPAAGSGR
jgi:hypothetical protein